MAKRATVLLALAGVLCLAGTGAQTPKRLAITLMLVRADNPKDVEVRTDVKNVSAHVVQIDGTSPTWEYVIYTTGPDGRPAPFTESEKKVRSGKALQNGSHVDIALPPGEVTSQTWNLSDYIAFPRPGTYKVKLGRTFEAIKETDVSNTITITIR